MYNLYSEKKVSWFKDIFFDSTKYFFIQTKLFVESTKYSIVYTHV